MCISTTYLHLHTTYFKNYSSLKKEAINVHHFHVSSIQKQLNLFTLRLMVNKQYLIPSPLIKKFWTSPGKSGQVWTSLDKSEQFWTIKNQHLPNHACWSPCTSIAKPKSANFTAAPFCFEAKSKFSGFRSLCTTFNINK